MRQARVTFPDQPHHIVLRGNNLRTLFSYPREYEHFVRLLGRGLQQSWVELHALALTRDEVQALVTPPTATALPTLVKYACQTYAQARNQLRQQSGRLFADRFVTKVIRSEPQLALTTAYIELAPVRAGLVARPEEYPWSTFGLHARSARCRIPRELWTPTEWYGDLGRDRAERERLYAQFVQEVSERDRRPDDVKDIELNEALSSLGRGLYLRRPNASSAR